MPPQAGEKMAFVVSNLLAAILFQQLVGSIMPPLGDEVPVLSKEVALFCYKNDQFLLGSAIFITFYLLGHIHFSRIPMGPRNNLA